jgi:hypothetical protein
VVFLTGNHMILLLVFQSNKRPLIIVTHFSPVNQHPPTHHPLDGCPSLLSCGWTSTKLIFAFTLVHNMWLQTVKFIAKKSECAPFSSGNWFFCTKFVQLAVARKGRNTVVHLQKKVYQIRPDCGSVFLIGRS